MPSQALSQEDGRTGMVRTSLDHQGCFYFQLCLQQEGSVYTQCELGNRAGGGWRSHQNSTQTRIIL